ncbi:MAG: helix-turn-helix domain-containing protein [Pseudonocardiaceae bacterium]
MDTGEPVVPSRRLGRELRRLRDVSGHTQVQVAKHVGTASTTISKIETGERNAPIPHLKLMLQLYQVAPGHAKALVRLAEQARQPGWWMAHRDDVPHWFIEYVGLESEAEQVWTYEQGYFPGLLQTERYTEAVTVAANTAETSESAQGVARVRATRQLRLRGAKPVVLRAVIDEAVLHRQVGGPDVMREQVVRLRQAMSQPNITVQIMPFSLGAHPGQTGPFTVLRYSERSMNMVYVEVRGGSVYLDRSKDIDIHEVVFEELSRLALSEDDTASLLSEMERKY